MMLLRMPAPRRRTPAPTLPHRLLVAIGNQRSNAIQAGRDRRKRNGNATPQCRARLD